MNTGARPGRLGQRAADDGRLAARAATAPAIYALEGSVFVAGAAVQWLRDGLRAGRDAAEIEALADTVDDTGGRLPRAGVRRARRAVLGRLRPGHPDRAHPRDRAGRDLARHDRRDGLPGRRRRRGDGRRLRGPRSTSSGSTAERPATIGCASSRPTCSASRSSGRSTPRRPRSAPRRWPGWRSGSGPTRPAFAATRAVDRRFEPAMTADRASGAAPRLAPGGRAVAELGRAGRLTARPQGRRRGRTAGSTPDRSRSRTIFTPVQAPT